MESKSCGGVDGGSTEMLWEAICDTNAQAWFSDDLKIYELAYSSRCDGIIVQAMSLVLVWSKVRDGDKDNASIEFNDAARRSQLLYVKPCN
jgi:hypothetical protein